VRYLIVSDLHANLEALEAVLADSAGRWDRVLCCGDLVGYGADPNPVCDWARKNCELTIRGNHDRASAGLEDLEWFNPVARHAALWTCDEMTPENSAYVTGLPRGPVTIDGFQLFHGAPHDEDDYMTSPLDASVGFEYLEARIAFFGHTHLQGGFIWNQSRVETLVRVSSERDAQTVEIDPDCAYMINPGSTGQPRDGDPRAAYLIFDTSANLVTHRRVAYDVAGAQRKIQRAGLPLMLADRLALGR
jgi:predicted phosphodiesterase